MRKNKVFSTLIAFVTMMSSHMVASAQGGEQGIPAGLSDGGMPPVLLQNPAGKHMLQGGVREQKTLPDQNGIQGGTNNNSLMGGANQQDLFPNLAPPMQASAGQQQLNGNANGNQLNGNLNGHQFNLGASAVNRLGQPLQGSGRNEISALGLDWQMHNGKVNAIDPASDLFGIVEPGDRILALDGQNPYFAWKTGQNFGSIGSICVVTYMHDGVVNTVNCRRQAVSNFQPKNAKMLNWGALHNQ